MQKNVTIVKIGILSTQEHEAITLACRIRNVSELTQALEEIRSLPDIMMVEADIHDANRKDVLNDDIEL